MLENKLSCFYCEHLILDGMSSWCDLKNHCATSKAADTCADYSFNKIRYDTSNLFQYKKKNVPNEKIDLEEDSSLNAEEQVSIDNLKEEIDYLKHEFKIMKKDRDNLLLKYAAARQDIISIINKYICLSIKQ